MPFRDLTDVTLVSKDHDGPYDNNECDDPDYHYGNTKMILFQKM